MPKLKFTTDSEISKNGEPNGLIDQLYKLSQISLFSELSMLKFPLQRLPELDKIYTYTWTLKYPEVSVIANKAKTLLAGISYLSKNINYQC